MCEVRPSYRHQLTDHHQQTQLHDSDKMLPVQALHQWQLDQASRSQQEEAQELVFKGRRRVWVDQDSQAPVSQADLQEASRAEVDRQEGSHLQAFHRVVVHQASAVRQGSSLLPAVVVSRQADSPVGRWKARTVYEETKRTDSGMTSQLDG